ncbi:MAG: hypothetical protein CMF51_03155 [Legionellales bacterium]|nr:hypothetical protein [Legionellales bacterium]|tara:strand:- start:745 stop:1125 length:381 start_codon:yes stop_codon:yes gene_type:complete
MLRILIVEDTPVAQTVACWLMKDLGFEFDLAECGQAALDRLKEDSNYDLILMDLGLPDIRGDEVTQKLRDSTSNLLQPKTKIVALTAHVPLDCAELFDAVMKKPLLQDIFEETLAEVGLMSVKSSE